MDMLRYMDICRANLENVLFGCENQTDEDGRKECSSINSDLYLGPRKTHTDFKSVRIPFLKGTGVVIRSGRFG